MDPARTTGGGQTGTRDGEPTSNHPTGVRRPRHAPRTDFGKGGKGGEFFGGRGPPMMEGWGEPGFDEYGGWGKGGKGKGMDGGMSMGGEWTGISPEGAGVAQAARWSRLAVPNPTHTYRPIWRLGGGLRVNMRMPMLVSLFSEFVSLGPDKEIMSESRVNKCSPCEGCPPPNRMPSSEEYIYRRGQNSHL